MYIQEVDNNWLYPGDVLSGISLISLNSEPFKLITENEQAEYSVRQKLKTNLCVYLSHECDFNSDKRQYFLISPLNRMPGNILRTDEYLKLFIDSNNIESKPHYLNYFYYMPHDNIIINHMTVDFTRMLHIPTKLKEYLLSRKQLQLNDDNRKMFKRKIAHYFGHE